MRMYGSWYHYAYEKLKEPDIMIINTQDKYYCRSCKHSHGDELETVPCMQICERDDERLEETVDCEPVHVPHPTMITIDNDKPDPERKKILNRTDPSRQTPQRDPVEPQN